ncbi:hypothetical protein C3L33_04111, partial [Rhododendron williamsianum]
MFSSWAEFMEMLTDNGDLIVYVVGVFSTLQLYARPAKFGFRGFLGSAAQEQLPQSEALAMSLVANEEFQHILRVQNTNVDGKQKIMAGELSMQELDNLMTIVANPRQFKIPDWFLNRKKDYKDGKFSQVTSNALDMKLRDDLERLKKIRNHRGLRHYWGLRVRGSIPRPLAAGGRLLVSPRSDKIWF